MQNSMLSTIITSLYGNQTSPVVLCMQNSVLRFRITSLNLSQLSSVVFAYKTGTLAPELLVSMVPRPHQSFCACITVWLAPELLYLWVPALICGFWMQNSDFRTRITSVCGFQTSSVVLSTHNSMLSTRTKRQYGFQPSPVVLCMQTATLALELLVSIVLCPHLRFLHANQRLLEQNNKSLCIPDLTCDILHAKQRG